MKVLVIGAGALGSLVGGKLSADHDVTILGRPEQVEALNGQGLRIEGLTQGRFNPRAVVGPVTGEQFDLIVLCVKAYNTDVILDPVAAILTEGTCILSLQNGLDNEERIAAFLRRRSLPGLVIGGTTCQGATYKGPGLVRHAGQGETIIGRFGDQGADAVAERRIADIADAFSRAGLEAEVSPHVTTDIWSKAIVNAAINPLTAIIGRTNAVIVDNADVHDMAADIVRESAAVARACGHDLADETMLERTFAVARRTADNASSMLQDVKRRRRTEIDAINGAIAAEAHNRGAPFPLNLTMVRLVKALEDEYRHC